MKNNKVRVLVEGAIMVALAFVLSWVTKFIPFLNLPWGGSITLLSMLPIVVYSIRNGIANGLMCSFVYSLTQLAQGAVDGLFGWGLAPAMLVACIFLDYIGAFTVLGFAGMFRGKGMEGWIGGTVTVIFVRYVFHVISGAVVFASAGKLWESLEINDRHGLTLGEHNRPPRKLTKHRPTCPFALKYIQYSCGNRTAPYDKIAASYGTSPVSEELCFFPEPKA